MPIGTEPDPEPEAETASAGIPQLAKVIGAIVAPTSLLTALLFYFGWMHAYRFFEYFGVHSTLLGLTTEDYLMRSLDGLFIPLIVAGCVGLLLLYGHEQLAARLSTSAPGRSGRRIVRILTVVGIALVVGSFPSVFVRTPLDRLVAVTPLCLASGVLLLVYVRGMRRRIRTRPDRPERSPWIATAEWAGVFILVGLSLFWATTDYSSAVGRSRARQFVQGLESEPNAVIYSTRSLNLTAPGIQETHCRSPGGAFEYRYDGLKLVLQSGGQYIFIPARWTTEDGIGIVLPRTDTIRLEFTHNDTATARPGRSTCRP